MCLVYVDENVEGGADAAAVLLPADDHVTERPKQSHRPRKGINFRDSYFVFSALAVEISYDFFV